MAEAPGAHWTRTRDIRDTVRRWWRRGDIARAVLPPVLSQVQLPELQIPGTPCVVSATSGADTPVSDDESTVALAFPRRMPLRAPGTGEIANVFDAVRDWVREIDALDVRCRIEHREIRHRQLGRNRLPCAVWFDTPEQAARFIGESTALETVRSRGAELLAHDVRLGPWLQRRPLQLTALEDRFARVLVVHAWMRERPRPGCYLREIDVPGVDSKFIETHRELLAAWLDATLPPTAIDDRYRGISGFARRYGFRERVPRIRLRSLDPERPLLATCAGLPLTTADLTLDAISAAALAPPHRQALIVENEINYLALPDLPDTIALFGAGYGHEAIA